MCQDEDCCGKEVDEAMTHAREAVTEPTDERPRWLRGAYPTQGFELEWDRDIVCITATDYHATPLVLSWATIFDMALATQKLPPTRRAKGD